ncbi:sugar phosphate nucleotidyltransferase, partial [Photobacterium leiognathi]|uniref:sugar phosphate nucleotidyltransferase n=1 Tax=Photobacterium leiognathi TaxID=553611 RepID=UPI0029811B60
HPETGYGYIHRGEALNNDAYCVDAFVEKPQLETAKAYVASGEYYWNSGMFLFKASRYIAELEKYAPEILKACQAAMDNSSVDLDFTRLDKKTFMACPDDSIDYAVMEKTQDAVVVPMDANWSDVGSWSALWEVNEKDASGNATRGDVLVENTTNSYIYSQDKLVATVGV